MVSTSVVTTVSNIVVIRILVHTHGTIQQEFQVDFVQNHIDMVILVQIENVPDMLFGHSATDSVPP
jgi:hypothetical protein